MATIARARSAPASRWKRSGRRAGFLAPAAVAALDESDADEKSKTNHGKRVTLTVSLLMPPPGATEIAMDLMSFLGHTGRCNGKSGI